LRSGRDRRRRAAPSRRNDPAGPAGALGPGQADRWRLGMGGGSPREAAGGVGTVHVACGPPGDWAGRRADRTAGRRHCLLPARFTYRGGACEGWGVGRLAAHGVAAPRELPGRVRGCGRRRDARGPGGRARHGRPRGPHVRAGLDLAERGLVDGDGAAALAGRAGRPRAPAQKPRRRLPRRARALSDARAGRGDRAQAGPALLDLPADAVSGRPLPRSRLDALVPSLLTGQALVSLVPATGDHAWAAGAAWDVARAAAKTDRRVALVDLWLERPTLHDVVGLSPAEGIVDAFEYDVSLTKAAHEIDRVFFIAAGTVTAHAGDLFANPRWRKLHGGFRSEDALLLLYLSAGALARLSTVPDGLLVLSADGYEPESSIGQGIGAAMERGIPLLGVVRERWTPLAAPVPDPRSVAPPPGRISAAMRPPVRGGVLQRRTRPVVIAATLAAGTAGGWALLARGAEQRAPSRPPVHAAPAPAPAPAPSATPQPRADSLAWTVQLAAYARLDRALALADRLAADGITPFVTPVTLGPRRGGTVWYRVL